jgi:hypothetical protein
MRDTPPPAPPPSVMYDMNDPRLHNCYVILTNNNSNNISFENLVETKETVTYS